MGDLRLIPGWKDPLEKGKATDSEFWPGELVSEGQGQTGLSYFHFQGE